MTLPEALRAVANRHVELMSGASKTIFERDSSSEKKAAGTSKKDSATRKFQVQFVNRKKQEDSAKSVKKN